MPGPVEWWPDFGERAHWLSVCTPLFWFWICHSGWTCLQKKSSLQNLFSWLQISGRPGLVNYLVTLLCKMQGLLSTWELCKIVQIINITKLDLYYVIVSFFDLSVSDPLCVIKIICPLGICMWVVRPCNKFGLWACVQLLPETISSAYLSYYVYFLPLSTDTFWSDFTYYADTSDCLFPFPFPPYTEAHVRYGSSLSPLYNMILQLTLYNTILWLTSVQYQSQSHHYYDTWY